MKIDLLSLSPSMSSFGGGVSSVVSGVSKYFSPLGIDNTLLTTRVKNDAKWLQQFPALIGEVSPHSIGDPRFGFGIGILLKAIKCNSKIIHLHGLWSYSSVVARFALKRRVKLIISPHGMVEDWGLKRSVLKKRVFSTIVQNKLLDSAVCIHALNVKELNSLRGFGVTCPIAVIPNGVEVPDVLLERNNVGRIRLLYLGRLHKIKGLDNLLEAVAILADKGVDFWLGIAGWSEDDYEISLKKYVSEKNLDGVVEFLGPVFGDEKSNLLSGVDSIILPSLSEGLPMTALEAWGLGVPVIATSNCNLEFAEGQGMIKLGETKEGMVTDLSSILESGRSTLSAQGKAGYSLVSKEYSWDLIASRYLELYKWVLGQSPQPDFVDKLN